MDCYSVESEFIESLDFLSPPVKRIHNSREAFSSVYQHEPSNVHLLRGLRNKFARRTPSSTPKNTRTVKTNAESSTSLILKKTSERQILEQYSILSYTSLHPGENIPSQKKLDKNQTCEKPLIKVTVIPKSDQIQTAKILRKRRYMPKRVSSTTSNQENSVQTKNVYLIVAGRRREKIYEIKTTGSAKFSTDHDSCTKDEEIPIKELSNFRHLMRSLNMDRKKKKDKSVAEVNFDVPQQTSMVWNSSYPQCVDCECEEKKEKDVPPPPQVPKRSRLRIFGQFGISKDDKYVLRYGATVNDKEVLSDVARLTRDFSPVVVPKAAYGTSYEEELEHQKDSCIQADSTNEINLVTVADRVPSKESQGTQVNFGLQIANASMEKAKISKCSDKKIQCNVCTVDQNRSDHKGLKDCQSPLVIISVYPKQSPEDITIPIQRFPDIISSPSPPTMDTYTSNQMIKMDKSTNGSSTERRRNYKTTMRSRSPSPIKNTSIKIQDDKSIETRVNKTQVTEKRSPDRQKALRAIKEKIKEKDKLKQDMGTRKSSQYIVSNATQVSKNMHNVTVSNATQVSNKNRQNITSSNATQVSAKNRQNYSMSNATQCSKNSQKTLASSPTQYVYPQSIAPNKHPKSVISPTKHSQISYASNGTQATKIPQHHVASNATQATNSRNRTSSNGTQVPKIPPNFITSRLSKNQATYTVPVATKVTRNDQSSKNIMKVRERGTNTDHARTKKALVETYTKKLTEKMNQKDYFPARYDSSKVTINIDGDKEYYDVLFNQDKLSTDLTIRKTLKDMGSQKYEDQCTTSLENLLFLPECTEAKGGISLENRPPKKSMSLALYNQSDEESPLDKHVSRLTIRDSLEISHRREDKTNSSNIKNTQTCFTAQISENSPDDTEFLAPIKHYTGDDCSICDPIERDRQVRELLGVEKNKLTYTKTQQVLPLSNLMEKAHHSGNDAKFPYQCFYRKECEKSQVTEINFQFHKLCPCLKTPRLNHRNGKSVSIQCQHTSCRTNYNHNNYVYDEEEEDGNDNGSEHHEKCCVSPARFENDETVCENDRYDNDNEHYCTNDKCCVDDRYQNNYDKYNTDEHNPTDNNEAAEKDDQKFASKEKSAIYQQLVLNRNIQVFLQVEQFSKQKPIVLSRKQYNKVKKTIQKTICKKKSSHDKRKKYVCDKCERSEVSVGLIRKKKGKDTKCLRDKEAQTDLAPCGKQSCRRGRKCYSPGQKGKTRKTKTKQISIDQSDEQSEEPEEERPRKTRRSERSKSRNRRKGKRHDNKTKQEENIDLCLPYSANPSWCSDQSENLDAEETEKIPILEEMEDKNRVPFADRIKECQREELVGRFGDRNVERFTKLNVEYHVNRGSEIKEDRGPERYSEQKRERSPESYCEQKRERDPERQNEERKERSPKQYSEQKKDRSPERYSEQKRDRSLERYSEQKRDRSSERYSEQKRDRSSERYSEQKRDKSPGLFKELKTERTHERHSELKRERSPVPHSELKRERNAERPGELKRERNLKRESEQKRSRSPERYSVQKREPSPDRYSEINRDHRPNRHMDQKLDSSPDRDSADKASNSSNPNSDINEEQNLIPYPKQNSEKGVTERKETEVKTLILFNADDTKGNSKNAKVTDKDSPTRKTVSSVEIRYASVAYLKHIAYSSTDVGALSESSLAHVTSFRTIFRGHRKSPTPNLGTSAYSLYSEEGYNTDKSAKFIMEPRDSKPKKPFLRRLMSCLVMRSTRESELKLPAGPEPDLPSVNSSIDSYHISTSLGAVEVSSSIYDTSASFYSNHTILPVNSKIKRGFFSSVRGFLTNRKS